jgi:arginase
MNIQIFAVPYDSGHRARRAGRGPERFLAAGLEARLRGLGHTATVEMIETDDVFTLEAGTSYRLYRRLAERINEAAGFPLVLAGNCGSSLGALAALGNPGLVWFDCHGDFNTPETTQTGFVDGMPLAAINGLDRSGRGRSSPRRSPASSRCRAGT